MRQPFARSTCRSDCRVHCWRCPASAQSNLSLTSDGGRHRVLGTESAKEETAMTLNCGVRRRGDVTILDLSGLLSLGEPYASGPESGVVLREKVHELIENGQKKILLNLAGVRFVDSSCAGQLAGPLCSARNHAAAVKPFKPPSQLQSLLNAEQAL